MTESITIQGHEFNVPVRYAEGHVLKAHEAKALNQTYHENLRNNFAGKVKDKNKEHGVDIKAEDYEPLPDHIHAGLQSDLDKYADEFQFAVRSGGNGGGPVRDPVRAEALTQVRRALKEALKKAGQNWKDVDSDHFEDAVKQALEANPAFLDSAKAVVAQRQQAASIQLQGLNVPAAA